MEWTPQEVAQIGATDEILISTARRDGSYRRWTPIWVVEHGGSLYVRSAYGPGAAWYRHARDDGARIRAGASEFDVTLEADAGSDAQVDAEYRRKYAGQASSVRQMIGDEAAPTTVRLVKAD